MDNDMNSSNQYNNGSEILFIFFILLPHHRLKRNNTTCCHFTQKRYFHFALSGRLSGSSAKGPMSVFQRGRLWNFTAYTVTWGILLKCRFWFSTWRVRLEILVFHQSEYSKGHFEQQRIRFSQFWNYSVAGLEWITQDYESINQNIEGRICQRARES